ARSQAVTGLRFAASFTGRPFPSAELMSGLRDAGIDAVLRTSSRSIPSDPRVDPEIPTSLRAVAGTGDVGYEPLTEPRSPGPRPEPLLIVGGPIGTTGR